MMSLLQLRSRSRSLVTAHVSCLDFDRLLVDLGPEPSTPSLFFLKLETYTADILLAKFRQACLYSIVS